MPPRVSPHRLPQPTSCQCFRTRPSTVSETSARPFSSTPNHAARERQRARNTRRQAMFDWLNGPGKVFRDPLPNSTNYLSAYDRTGNLLRTKKTEQQKQLEAEKEDGLDMGEETLQKRDLDSGMTEEEVMKRADERTRMRLDRADLEGREGVPKERQSDLRPYPLNQNFTSQAVLSEELRERIYELVVENEVDIKAVSGAFGVDIRRVAAVVRLKTIEKQWLEEGKPLATPYSKAVLAMLPTTPLRPELKEPPPHESINDLPVHPSTRKQLFVSTSESRDFSRADAAKSFNPKLLPADDRIAHPELVQLQKWINAGIPRSERQQLQQQRDEAAAAKSEEAERKRLAWEKRTQVVVPSRRWDFKFQDYSAEKVGKDGRQRGAVGLRYGMPHEDRKRGQYKLPQKVE